MLNPITSLPVNTPNNTQNNIESNHSSRSDAFDRNEESFDSVLVREISRDMEKSDSQSDANILNHELTTEEAASNDENLSNTINYIYIGQHDLAQSVVTNTGAPVSSVAVSVSQPLINPIANLATETKQHVLQQLITSNDAVLSGIHSGISATVSAEGLNSPDLPETAFNSKPIRSVSLLNDQDHPVQSSALISMSRQYVAAQTEAGTANFAAQREMPVQLIEAGMIPSNRVNESVLVSLSDPASQTGLAHFSAPSSVNSSAVTQPIADLQVYTQVGQPKWGGDFAQKIVLMASQHNQVAEIRLNPAHLGPVEVSLNIINDQGTQAATAHFVSAHLAVREAIEASLPKLREMLAESGIELGNVTVGAESSEQQAYPEQQQSSGKFSNPKFGPNIESGEYSSRVTTTVLDRHQGLVNTFA